MQWLSLTTKLPTTVLLYVGGCNENSRVLTSPRQGHVDNEQVLFRDAAPLAITQQEQSWSFWEDDDGYEERISERDQQA